MSKYIIDIPDNVKKIVYFHLGNANAVWTTSNDLDDLEQLNSDYINEHFGELQDQAYHKGLEEGNDIGYKDGVKDGQNEAWEAARKLFSSMAESDIEKAFPTEWNNGGFRALINLQPQEAIEKLKAYEEKQKADDEIKVGDIVERYLNGKLDSTGIYLGEDGDYWNCLFWTGAVFGTFAYPKNQFKKTEKHVDIASILEDMKHD